MSVADVSDKDKAMFYEAVYQPEDTENLSDKAKLFVGKRIAIQDGGQNEVSPGKIKVVYIAVPSFGLIPNTDLQNITSIPYSKWTELSELNRKELQG